jgi:hypothetical protein
MNQDYDQMTDQELLALYEQEKARVAGKQPARLPSGQQTQESEDIQGIQTAAGINNQLDQVRGKIATGALKLGPVTNAASVIKNLIGKSDTNSRNYGSLKATLEKLRNDSLRLNKGTQTEGDAQRAWNELLSSLNDQKLVEQRLSEIGTMNSRQADNRKALIQQRRAAQGVASADLSAVDVGALENPYDLSRGQSRSTIPLGAYYKDPFGNLRRNDNGDTGNPKIDALTRLQRKEAVGAKVSRALKPKVLTYNPKTGELE